jgi:hypothetical protein
MPRIICCMAMAFEQGLDQPLAEETGAPLTKYSMSPPVIVRVPAFVTKALAAR